ncbi:mitochondrial 54S ribosomal protein YmL11 [Saccharomycopsis crataegensis]|uniref:Mitochondrial 54S ribosomal protein YmL11 n=1 Tax=Saccharomycopsis crataegensis TaxID=43959 RepID=A0AAV5QIL6_9ASCO|nr:mitochondrial 54S ribosomal protein YmL11 [Saccharomycopsis crataegensis]
MLGKILGLNTKTSVPSITSRWYATAVKRNTFKPLDSRKTFLIDSYASLMRHNQLVLFAHRNNLVKNDDDLFRSQIKQLGGELVVINNSLMKVYLRSEKDEDPADAQTTLKNKRNKHPLFSVLNGPTAAIAFKENDPSKIKQLYKVLKAAKEKLFVVGAKVDDDFYSLDKLDTYKDLPSKPELQAQLVGLLNILGGYGLTRTLESASNVLHLTLKSHHDNVENPKTEQEESK